MPRYTKSTPPLKLHKSSGRGYVTLSGRRVYCGPYTSPDARKRYDAAVAAWLAADRRDPTPAPADPAGDDGYTVVELCRDYWRYSKARQVGPDGKPLNGYWRVKGALKALRTAFGSLPAAKFGPIALREVRRGIVAEGLTRRCVNDRIARIVGTAPSKARNGRCVDGAFRWAVEHERLPAEVWHRLQAVAPLGRGEAADDAGKVKAKEEDAGSPVPAEHVEAVKPYLPTPVRALVEVQYLVGCRPGELLSLRPCDIDRTGDVWRVVVSAHKNAWRGKGRVLRLGAKAQAVLLPLLDRNADATLFDPRESCAEMKARGATEGKPRRPDQAANPARTARTVGETYTTGSYRRCVERACVAAGVPVWTPHQLRHARATEFGRTLDVEQVRATLGHDDAGVTRRYMAGAITDKDERAVEAVMRLVG